ncbi:unnamed protein product [Parascedosporium putredinis]|uniref:Uncharacterized protein n=1 Tax=Parascedosporium putredinis TaxID=1442378 RepID=A0A9P1H2G7_9PEZI|nr:unnamed protein product [Parascedosporium putredinis]CAI7993657.1 unnamed protein product [Parascedosporium putredinis]
MKKALIVLSALGWLQAAMAGGTGDSSWKGKDDGWLEGGHHERPGGGVCCHNVPCQQAIADASNFEGYIECGWNLGTLPRKSMSPEHHLHRGNSHPGHHYRNLLFQTVATSTSVVSSTTTLTITLEDGDGKKKRDTGEAANPTGGGTGGQVPDYAAEACGSWEKYLLGCKCLGAEPSTITLYSPTYTTVVTSTSVLTVSRVLVDYKTVTTTKPITAVVTSTTIATVTTTVIPDPVENNNDDGAADDAAPTF